MAVLKRVAEEMDLSVDPQAIFDPSSPEGRKLADLLTIEVQNHLKKIIGSYEVPRKFAFIKEDFTLDNGMLTQTMKLKRKVIMDKYGEMLESLYRE